MSAGDFRDGLRQLVAEVRRGAADGLLVAGEHVLGESNAHTPHEEGPLERSGKVTVDEDALEVAVSYDTPYAVRQHEDLTYRHDPGRTAKFLENAMNAESATCGQIVATSIRRRLGT
jgi:hypothetical protein